MKYSEEISKFEIIPFSTSHKDNKYLLIYNEKHFEISHSLCVFIEVLQNKRFTEEVAIEYSQKRGIEYTATEVDEIYLKYVAPILNNESHNKTSFYLKLNLISPSSIGKFVKMTSAFFIPAISLILLVLILVLEIASFIMTDNLFGGSNEIGLSIIVTFIYFCISSFFHELGHASACEYYKIKYGSIGIGVYLLFPVFFTDVSDIWRLSRTKRIIVNFAGIYFQLIALIPFLLVYVFTKSELMMYFITAININLLITLNPFFKFDGYWICTDILGIPNLRSRTKELLFYFCRKILSIKTEKKPFLLMIKPKEKWGFIVYSLLINVFFLYFFLYKLPVILINTLDSLPTNIKIVLYYFSTGNMPSSSLILSLCFQLIILILTSLTLVKVLGVPLLSFVKNKKI